MPKEVVFWKNSFDSILVRNIEYYNFGADQIHTKVTELESDYIGNHIKTGNQSGNLRAWFLHLAEGMDESVEPNLTYWLRIICL